MTRRGARRLAQIVGLIVIAVLAWTGCTQDGSGEAGEAARIVPRPPRAPLLPGALPEGFEVEGVSMAETVEGGTNRALLIGRSDGDGGPGSGPVIVVGTSEGSASMAGPPSAGGEPVPDHGDSDFVGPYIADDGSWTWVVFNDGSGRCIEDCLAYVAGRGVRDEDLISVARGTSYRDDGPVVDAEAVPDGMAPLVTGEPADGVLSGHGSAIWLREVDGPGRITLQQVDAAAELAFLWGFWIDDAHGTPIRGRPGWAGPIGATIEGGDVGRVWVEDGSVVAVVGWDVSGAALDGVIDGLRPGTPDDLAALGDPVVAPVPTTVEAT